MSKSKYEYLNILPNVIHTFLGFYTLHLDLDKSMVTINYIHVLEKGRKLFKEDWVIPLDDTTEVMINLLYDEVVKEID